MEQLTNLKDITKSLSVLCVEDEMTARLFVEHKLHSLFKEVFMAGDGIEALEIYRSHKVDLILTDNLMPRMNGMELIKEIRKTDAAIPIILITGYIDNDILIDAINSRVTHFIAKPFSYKNLFDALEIAARISVFENIVQKANEQELQILRYKEQYHSGQQEMAFRKEINFIRNELLMKTVEIKKPDETLQDWLIEVEYKPLDVMCGDSYSIRDLGGGRVFMFLLDAMGKGLSASVTSVLSTSFINHSVDVALQAGKVGLSAIVEQYIEYLKKGLLEDEALCVTFLVIDFLSETMEMAAFSMPRILGMTTDGSLVNFSSNNLPIMTFTTSCEIDKIDISGISAFLIYTDGVNESVTSEHHIYGKQLNQDFADSLFLGQLKGRFHQAVEKPEDDVTLFFIRRLSYNIIREHNFSISTRLSELYRVTGEVENILDSAGVDKKTAARLMCVFTELLRNAYEHGNLKIDAVRKCRLIADDTFDEFMLELETGCTDMIDISVFMHENNRHNLLSIRITDAGDGFDMFSLKLAEANDHAFCGRGIKISQGFVDEIYFNDKGNSVTISVDLTKEG
jgi:CheY-like chemotaxis protein/anti-sigma regulatory factor (Ser/Thr protein kinase)